MFRLDCVRSTAVLWLFCLVSVLRAQVPHFPLDGPAFAASAGEILAAAAPVKPEPFTSVTVLFEQERYRLDAAGKVTRTHQLLYRIETQAGIDQWSQASVQWDPWFQNQPVIRARVIRPDGKLSEFDTHTLTDVPARNESDDTFSDARVSKGPLPSLAIGALVEEETVVADKLPFFDGGSVYRVYLSRDVPVIRSKVIVEMPSGSPYRSQVHSLPGVVAHSEQADGIRRETWDFDNVPLSPVSDIDLATAKPLDPFIEFSTGESWASVAAAYRKLAEPRISISAVKPLLPATLPPNRLAAIQVLASRLHKEVRYTGIEFGESALQPQAPGEVLKRHYGDCKDKAAFLVAMLRASGIPADLALLNAGPGLDLSPDLPGMNQFDHAIVHVPAGAAKDQLELWIDATAEFTRIGDLPYGDQGRLALLIADGTTALTPIPPAKPEDNVLVETREFILAPIGPAHIVETSSTTGHVDSEYRGRYGAAETKEVKDDLDQYSKRAYGAKALTRVDHGDGSDFSKPFVLRLDMASAVRGSSGVDEAVVAIPPAGVLNRLPRWFSTDPDAGDEKPTPDQLADRKKKEQARSSEYLVHPLITEWHYRILLPEGFVPRSLPEDQTVTMGPATLTRHYAADTNPAALAAIDAVFRFDTGKPVYSLEEALALRKAVLEEDRKDFLLLYADQAGAKLLTEGKTRQALATDRALIAAHPSSAIHHVQLSSALLRVGLGEQSQIEARLATQLDPKLAIAFAQLGTALGYNSIGVFAGKGFDRAGTIAAYLKAKQLDPDEVNVRTALATMYEYNPQGDRYAEGSSLADAIREYRELKAVDKDTAARFEDNLLYAMLYNRQFAELLTELATQTTDPTRDAMGIAAVAASQTTAAAIERAEHVGDAQQKNAALRLAGQQLIHLNLYAQAAAILTAGIQGQDNAADTSRQIDVFRTLRHAPLEVLPATDPRSPVNRMMGSMMAGTLSQTIPTLLTRHAYATDKEWQHNLDHNDSSGFMVTIARKAQLPVSVLADVMSGNMKFSVTGDDAHGYRVSVQSIGSAAQEFFVTREDAGYKIVASSTDSTEVGNYAFYLLKNGREPEARSLLDWKRSQVHRGGGDDPLEGDLFARFWTEASSNPAQATPEAIEIAALALTVEKANSHLPLDPALALYKNTSTGGRADLALLLASAYLNRNDGTAALPYVSELLEQYPDSATAIALAGQVYALRKDYAAWTAMLTPRLAKRPSDRDLLLQAAFEAESQGNFAAARAQLQKVLDSGKATSGDYNSFAWLALFDGQLDDAAVKAGQQSNVLSKNASFADLHTLACVYAAQDKTTEARQLLFDAMAAGNPVEPDSNVWFGFGSIYQQFGENDAAIAAFKKVTAPDGPVNPLDTWVLAQNHLKELKAI